MALEFARPISFCLLAAVAGLMCNTSSVAAQPAAIGQSLPAPSWRVESNPDLDLWFHGLAVIGFDGYGPLRMYNAEYALKILAAKTRLGIPPTLLDRQAGSLRKAFERDSTFEVMHFLPLYFPSSRDGALLALLREVARGNPQKRMAGESSAQAALEATRVAFQTEEQRKTLSDFLDALEAERREFYGEYAKEQAASQQDAASRFAQFWSDSVLSPITPFLNTVGALTGSVVLSPSIGGEGRSLRVRGAGGGHSIVVVGVAASRADYLVPALSLVRELCFELVQNALAPFLTGKADRVSAERLSSVVAVRCGSDALELYVPRLLEPYQIRFLRAAGAPVPRTNLSAAFNAAFPVPRGVDNRIHRALLAH